MFVKILNNRGGIFSRKILMKIDICILLNGLLFHLQRKKEASTLVELKILTLPSYANGSGDFIRKEPLVEVHHSSKI